MRLISDVPAIKGEVMVDRAHRVMYSTDASVYSERPAGVCFPTDTADIITLVKWAGDTNTPLIPRAGGTSLAGQDVGSGMVVDVSRHLTEILEIDAERRTARVQPGVIRDELNRALQPYGLFFSPETSTSSRCCIGGMTANNSCGSHSVAYGSVRDHLASVKMVLDDGKEVEFGPLAPHEVDEKLRLPGREGDIYRGLIEIIGDKERRRIIAENYPDPKLRRRNTGYALDLMARSSYFDPESGLPFNVCDIIAGSEGTLGILTELTLSLDPLPPKERTLICVHCKDLWEAFDINLEALRHSPIAVELIDSTILRLSKENIGQSRHRWWVEGDPAAVVVIEIADHTPEEGESHAQKIEEVLRAGNLGYAWPRVRGKKIADVWELRKAGLGLLSGMAGNRRPTGVIEDTAVEPARLKEFHRELKEWLDAHGLGCVYYAHIGSGEIHLRPLLDLDNTEEREKFREVAEYTAHLVRKFHGSLSGEHGDGRLRGEFIPIVLGEPIKPLLIKTKQLFDPKGIFNPGKIVRTPPMDVSLRIDVGSRRDIPTWFDFSRQGGWTRAVEQCNGTADCRKVTGGVMCPSYRATHREDRSTRGRANMLRTLLRESNEEEMFADKEMLEMFETCLSCKGCRSECPSNVDMTRNKAEWLQHRHERRGVPWRSQLTAMLPAVERVAVKVPWLWNGLVSRGPVAAIVKGMMGFDRRRSLPVMPQQSLRSWMKRNPGDPSKVKPGYPKVWLFADEFTDLEDAQVGIDFVILLRTLGYKVEIPKHVDSGRILLSKGMLDKARCLAERNVELLADIVSDLSPLVGLEPSTLLSFRDEYPDIVREEYRERAKRIRKNALLYDEFIVSEIEAGRIKPTDFRKWNVEVYLHGHCHQKSLASVEKSKEMLEFVPGMTVHKIDSGCCGMAGAFGYQKENYEVSMAVGEETLFPTVRAASPESLIAAPGVSCRRQILDGTGRTAYHPVTIMRMALK